MNDIIPLLNTAPVDEADIVLIWQDVSEKFIPMVKLLQQLGKRVILMTHCFGSCNDYLPPHNHISLADKILVWGQADYSLALQAGLAHKTVITGSTVFSHKKPRQKQKDYTVVIAPSHNNKTLEGAKKLANTLTKGGNSVYTKLIGEEITGFPNPVFSKQVDLNHIDICFDLLSKADAVIVDDPTTTFALFAFVCDIPVIYVELGEFNYYYINNFLKSGLYTATVETINQTIKKIKENDYKKEQRKLWADYCGANIKNPLENILREIQ